MYVLVPGSVKLMVVPCSLFWSPLRRRRSRDLIERLSPAQER